MNSLSSSFKKTMISPATTTEDIRFRGLGLILEAPPTQKNSYALILKFDISTWLDILWKYLNIAHNSISISLEWTQTSGCNSRVIVFIEPSLDMFRWSSVEYHFALFLWVLCSPLGILVILYPVHKLMMTTMMTMTVMTTMVMTAIMIMTMTMMPVLQCLSRPATFT